MKSVSYQVRDALHYYYLFVFETQTQKVYCLQVLKTSNNTAGTHSL